MAETKYCFACGETIDSRAEICPKCGVRQTAPFLPNGTKLAPNGKTRLAAILLALFLGGLGVHKFYLGRIGWGIVYLIFCWTFIPSIVAFIEFIIYLTMSDEAFIEKYGQS